MIHYRPKQGSSSENGNRAQASSRLHEHIDDPEALLAHVRRAQREADESLRRVQDAPEPHVSTNIIFVALYEAHLRDREVLFEAMRKLDDARAGRGAGSTEMKTTNRNGLVARQLAG
jgi:hypothetical protein